MSGKRRDNKNCILRNGESQRKMDDTLSNTLTQPANSDLFMVGN